MSYKSPNWSPCSRSTTPSRRQLPLSIVGQPEIRLAGIITLFPPAPRCCHYFSNDFKEQRNATWRFKPLSARPQELVPEYFRRSCLSRETSSASSILITVLSA